MNDSKQESEHMDKISDFTRSLRTLLQEIMFLQMGSLRTKGITIPKFFLMKFLYYHGKRKTSEISELLGISLPAVSEILSSMESENLIIRTHDENDRRVVAVELSAEGKELVNSLEKHNQCLIEEALDSMPVEHFEMAIDFLGKLTGILHNSVELKIKKSGESYGK